MPANTRPQLAAPGPNEAVPDHEHKFTIDARQADAIRRWLGSLCPGDPVFPYGMVNSIYFDTPSLAHLLEKINSDYLKTKVRLRWYDAGNGPASSAFLEAKFRMGSRRYKTRVEVPVEGEWLSSVPLDDPALRRIPERLRGLGVPVAAALRPVMWIRYRRDRFVDPITRTRISLDTDITVPAVNHELFDSASPLPLDVAVVEIKGQGSDVPRVLRHLMTLGGRKTSFSKYLACYHHVVNGVDR